MAQLCGDSIMVETNRLILRRWNEEDRPAFAEMNADPEVMKYFPTALSNAGSDALADRIEAGFAERGFGLWATELKASGAFIGFVGLHVPGFEAHFTPAVEVGWRLAKACWGNGYAHEGATAALDFGFNQLGLPEIVSFTSVHNQRSIRLMLRLDMTHNEADDFDHPNLPRDHWLCRHVLFSVQPSGTAASKHCQPKQVGTAPVTPLPTGPQ